ncbi:MAG TPA: hypothetical protein VK210_16170 [Terriglobia bacterium]|nr:hypothetical protein [Terriglobia bacterium]
MYKRYLFLLPVLLSTFVGNVTAQSKSEESLQKEQKNLERASDPVSRTKVQIKISELLITLVTDAARAGKDSLVEQRLNDYANTIQDAHLTMMKTGRDAHKHPAGFKDLEIALRKQQHRLSDIGKLLDYDQRGAVDKAQKLASDIGDQLVKVMLLKDPNAPHKP